MNDTRSTLCYPGFRFPAEIIGHAVWLYHRFTLSFRDIEDLLAERGILVTHETIRQWCLRFGQEYANSIRRRRPQPGDKWHLLTVRNEQGDAAAGAQCCEWTSGRRLISYKPIAAKGPTRANPDMSGKSKGRELPATSPLPTIG